MSKQNLARIGIIVMCTAWKAAALAKQIADDAREEAAALRDKLLEHSLHEVLQGVLRWKRFSRILEIDFFLAGFH